MNTSKYPLYGLALVAGAALMIWAGLPPFLLLFLLVCPLMMFFMMGKGGMGGMHGGQRHGEESRAPESAVSGKSEHSSQRNPDGTHHHTNRS